METNLLNKFRLYLSEKKYKESSVGAYVYDVKHFIAYLAHQTNSTVENKHFRHLTKSDIYLYINYLKNEKQNMAVTINRKLAVLRIFFDFLEEEGIVHANYAERISLRIIPKENVSSEDYFCLSDDCLKEYRSKMDDSFSAREKILFILVSKYALMPREIVDIKHEDIDIDNGLLHITGSNERMVYFREDSDLKGDLRDFKTTGGYLLSNKPEKAMSVRNVQILLSKICRKLFGVSIPAVALRKNAVKNYIELHNANLMQVKTFLGLKSISAVEKYL